MFMLKKTHRKLLDAANTETEAHERNSQYWEGAAARLTAKMIASRKDLDAARLALTEIANMETTSCASIGRRMAARARQELPGSAPVRAAMEAM